VEKVTIVSCKVRIEL